MCFSPLSLLSPTAAAESQNRESRDSWLGCGIPSEVDRWEEPQQWLAQLTKYFIYFLNCVKSSAATNQCFILTLLFYPWCLFTLCRLYRQPHEHSCSCGKPSSPVCSYSLHHQGCRFSAVCGPADQLHAQNNTGTENKPDWGAETSLREPAAKQHRLQPENDWDWDDSTAKCNICGFHLHIWEERGVS